MPIQWREVYSEVANRVGYDPEEQRLYVEWKRGTVSSYLGVPQEVADKVPQEWSVGRFIHNEIKPRYPHKKVS